MRTLLILSLLLLAACAKSPDAELDTLYGYYISNDYGLTAVVNEMKVTIKNGACIESLDYQISHLDPRQINVVNSVCAPNPRVWTEGKSCVTIGFNGQDVSKVCR